MTPTHDHGGVQLYTGDTRAVLPTLPADSVQCVVTSPPFFGLRSYLDADHADKASEMGSEPTPDAYVDALVAVFREVRRVLRPDGTCWVELGDSYAGSWGNQGRTVTRGTQRPITGPMLQQVHDGRYPAVQHNTGTPPPGLKPKDLIGIPWRVALALQADGWYLRSCIIWHKPNPMPESVTDRPTTAHSYVFLLAKRAQYYYDAASIAEPATTFGAPTARPPTTGAANHAALGDLARTTPVGRTCGYDESGNRNARSVWTIPTQAFGEAHFAVFPEALAERCILACSRAGDTVLDPFSGAGTTALVAKRLERRAMGIELNPAYNAMATTRLQQDVLPLFTAGEAAG